MKILQSVLRYTIVLAIIAVVPHLTVAQDLELPGRNSSKVRASPSGLVGQTIGTHDVSISYGRPYVKGRKVFGDLQPLGQVWRAGANEATAILIPADAKVEGEDLAAGVYSLFMIPGESEWTVIFNDQGKIWGTAHDPATDVLRVTVDAREAPHAEMLGYRFEDVTASSATVILHWGTTEVPFSLSFSE